MRRSAVRFHADARAEVLEAHRWYWERNESAGDAFLLQLELALDEIAEAPERWPPYLHGTRRFILRTFPYVIVYRRKRPGLQVVAVAHVKRRPGYWSRRLH